jgi:hypothetical protein
VTWYAATLEDGTGNALEEIAIEASERPVVGDEVQIGEGLYAVARVVHRLAYRTDGAYQTAMHCHLRPVAR